MNWEQIFDIKLESLGDSATEDQCDLLLSWVLENVPAIHWRGVAPWCPYAVCCALMMRGAESGY